MNTDRKSFITEIDFSGFPGLSPTMTFSSFFGGEGTASRAHHVSYDPAGNLFVRGGASASPGGGGGGRGGRGGGGGGSSGFPLVGAQIKTTPLDDGDSFLSVLAPIPGGFDLIYSTLIGGESIDTTSSTVLHSDGSVYMSTSTVVSEGLFTTGNAVFPTEADVPSSFAVYILKISSPL